MSPNPTFKIGSTDLKNILGAVNGVDDSGCIEITESGWEIYMVDPANVLMVSVLVPSGDFVDYRTREPLDMCISFADAISNLSQAGKDETVTIELTSDKKMKMSYGTMSYKQSLLDRGALREKPKLPELSFDLIVEVPIEVLDKSVKACSKVDGAIKLSANNDKLYAWAKSHTTMVESTIMEIPTKKHQVEVVLSTDYVIDIMKGIRHADTATLSMKTEYPIEIKASIYTTGEINYLMAPRITND